jgi:hypothetical protein
MKAAPVIRLVSISLLVSIVAVPVWSYDGATLLQDCSTAVKQYESSVKNVVPSEEGMSAERCRSYTWGAFTVLRSLQINKAGVRLLCAPATVKQEQVVRIVAKWLGDNPSKHHLPAEIAAVVSLREAFPCPKKTTGAAQPKMAF